MTRALVIACLVAASCKSKPPPPPPPPVVEGLVVLAPGAEPRVPLRYQLAPGHTASIELAIEADLKTVDMDLQLPRLVLAVDLATAAMAADGTATLRTTVTAASAQDRAGVPAAADLVNRQLATLVGLVQTATLSPTGVLGATAIVATPRDLAPPTEEQLATLTQSLQQVAMPLPAEPVGHGATWRYRKTFALHQLTVVATTTVHVTRIEGDRVAYTTTTELSGADQTITQGDTSAQVTGLRGHGAGTATADLAALTVTGTTSAELAFVMTTGGAPRPTTMRTVTRVGAPGSVATPPPGPAVPADAGPVGDAGAPSGDDDDHGEHNAP